MAVPRLLLQPRGVVVRVVNDSKHVTCVVCKRRLPKDKARELTTTDGWICPRGKPCVEAAVEKGIRG